jgi:hypothetical protein
VVPAVGPTVLALAITIAMALIGGVAARWLAENLAAADRVPGEL